MKTIINFYQDTAKEKGWAQTVIMMGLAPGVVLWAIVKFILEVTIK